MGPKPATVLWSTSCRTICGGPGGRARGGRPSRVGGKTISCTRLRKIPEVLFVRKVCLQCAPQTQECEAWGGCRSPAGSDWKSWGYRRGREARRFLLAPSTGLLDWSGSSPSFRAAASLSRQTRVTLNGSRIALGFGSFQLRKNTCRKKRPRLESCTL